MKILGFILLHLAKWLVVPAVATAETKPMVGHDKEELRNFEITPDKLERWEDSPRTVAEVERYAKVLAELPAA